MAVSNLIASLEVFRRCHEAARIHNIAVRQRRWRAVAGCGARPISTAPPYPRRHQPQPAAGTTAPAAAAADDSVGQVATLQGSATVTRGQCRGRGAASLRSDLQERHAARPAPTPRSASPSTTRRLSAFPPIRASSSMNSSIRRRQRQRRLVQRRDRHRRLCREPRRQDRRHEDHDAGSDARHSRHHRRGRCAGGGRRPRRRPIKLYPDADGHVGQIEVFDRQGGRLGALTQGASAFAIRRGAGGRLTAGRTEIPPQEAARDRGVLQRLNVAHTIGRQMVDPAPAIARAQSAGPNNQRRRAARRISVRRPAILAGRSAPSQSSAGGPGRPRPRGPKNDNRNR